MSLIKRERRAAWPLEPTWSDERVDRMFRDMFRDFFTGGALMDRLFDGSTGMMRLEEFVDGDTCVIRAELPGLDPEKDVEITVADGVLHLRAHREERTEEEQPDGYRSEFRYGRLERSVRLPEGVTEADVKATYRDGILEVRAPVAPRPDRVPATKIPVAKV